MFLSLNMRLMLMTASLSHLPSSTKRPPKRLSGHYLALTPPFHNRRSSIEERRVPNVSSRPRVHHLEQRPMQVLQRDDILRPPPSSRQRKPICYIARIAAMILTLQVETGMAAQRNGERTRKARENNVQSTGRYSCLSSCMQPIKFGLSDGLRRKAFFLGGR